MPDDIETYLATLSLSPAVRERVDMALRAFRFLTEEEVVAILLTDQIDPDEQRHYVDLWGITESFLMWSKDFLHNNNADISPYVRSISYLGIQYENLPWEGPLDSTARLSVEVQTAGRIYNELFATGENAGELRTLVEKYLKPNVRNSRTQ